MVELGLGLTSVLHVNGEVLHTTAVLCVDFSLKTSRFNQALFISGQRELCLRELSPAAARGSPSRDCCRASSQGCWCWEPLRASVPRQDFSPSGGPENSDVHKTIKVGRIFRHCVPGEG